MKSYWWTEPKTGPSHRPASVFGIKENIQATKIKKEKKNYNKNNFEKAAEYKT